MDYEELIAFCATDRQLQVISMLADGLSQSDVAKKLEVTTRSIERLVKRVRTYAVKSGHIPELNIVKKKQEGFSVKKFHLAEYHDADGNITGHTTNVSYDRDKEDILEGMMDAWLEFAETKIPRAKPIQVPAYCDSDLLCDYTIGDAHIGMYAWAKETGIDWDLLKGTDILRRGMNHLVQMAPPAHTAYIIDVGDYFHADNSRNETERSGHKLDVDGRYKKVIDEGLQAIVDMIDLALHKHNHVIYRSVIGNHNDHSAQMINIAIKMRYYNEPRVTVFDSPSIHHYYQFGTVLLADTHGHTHKTDKLPFLMALDVPEMWATTTERVWRTGHVHHESVKDFGGVKVITYPTLTPKDSWHESSGYRSNRDMRCSTYSKTSGYIGTNVVNPSKLGYE